MEGINNLIYVNNNGTTRTDARVAEAMERQAQDDPALVRAKAAKQLAELIQCKPSEIFFTGGTTPSIHLGIERIFNAGSHKGKHIITSLTEHAEVLKAVKNLEAQGAEITYLGVNREGLTDPAEVEAAIRPDTLFVSLMAANNHTGVIQPLEQVAAICRKHNLVLFSDASQFVGKMRCEVQELGADCIAFGSHKMYGPKDIGALYVKETTPVHQLLQKEQQAGSFSPALLAGFAAAAQLFSDNYWEDSAHISKLKNYFEHQLLDIEGLTINGSTRYRIYNTSNLTFPPGKDVHTLAGRFKFLSYRDNDAYVLKAMGLSEAEAQNSYRFSFGRYNTMEEIKHLVEAIMAL